MSEYFENLDINNMINVSYEEIKENNYYYIRFFRNGKRDKGNRYIVKCINTIKNFDAVNVYCYKDNITTIGDNKSTTLSKDIFDNITTKHLPMDKFLELYI